MNKFRIITIIATILILLGGVSLATKSSKSDNSDSINSESRVVITESNHDWGEIGLNDGNVDKEFEIKNEGSDPLKLFNVSTSCMCTTAQVITQEGESPEFGMHSKSDYVAEVAPGETAKLRVVFDPAYHGPSGVGPITRQIEVETNATNNTKLNFTLTANVRK